MDTISIGAGIIVAGGISLCIAGFTKAGLPLNKQKRITGKTAKIVGIGSMLASIAIAVVLISLRASVQW